ncbi:heme lyase CcmF/NrfE family subunit [Shewanella algidipiscicola]|uniref:Heme lyase CcmF/NrfE family subunit n=1 Tax=Shewanella algidipiscicola TaxID=614070 RepID=A0ABQ4P8P6_9GAMM|nr:heme lyase CcmF/NrfE family subunit [Shewanella algidipiscicola]GIU43511.1 heme lyase CcmF/NrfE family subunit [Shewanella algidipiscicola]
MAAEIGLLLLIIATVICLLIAVLPLLKNSSEPYTNALISLLIHLNTFALLGAMVILGYLFIANDFSVAYVANHSNTQLASVYKVAAVWGGHEGSMLFWITATALWSSFIVNQHKANSAFMRSLCAILAAIMCGFLLFLLFTSNPFARLLPNIPLEGRDLNPILQDIGLILHPPLLFIGYVGLTVCFAAAVAALLDTQANIQAHCRRIRPWAILTWVALTGGNAFGSWWAYNELGWGGWWFWDPVENASFIPWLVATAMMHALILSSKRDAFYASTLFTCLLGFAICLLGTFLVRSGVVQSVHAFAADPSRGVSILTLLLLFSAGGFTLFAYRAPSLFKPSCYSVYSKESLMMLGNLILLVAALSILLGTCYPLLYEVLTEQSISVGAPYFNSLFIPLLVLICLLMGAAPLVRWQQAQPKVLIPLALYAGLALGLAVLLNLITLPKLSGYFLCGSFSALWLCICIIAAVRQQYAHRAPSASRSQRFNGMCLAHLAVAVSILGATTVSHFEQDELLRMGPGQGKVVAGYTFVYEATEQVAYPSYSAIQAKIQVSDTKGQVFAYIYPQRQTFNTNGMQLSAAGIHRSLFGDIYISMGTPLSDSEYLVRISYKPLVNWIWIGALMMMVAGICLLRRPAIVGAARHTYSAGHRLGAPSVHNGGL